MPVEVKYLFSAETEFSKTQDNAQLFFDEFMRFFSNKVGFELNKLQRYWALKLSWGFSFSAVAPPGVGKSLFGIFYSAFCSFQKRKRSYIVVPTTTLLLQFKDIILRHFPDSAGRFLFLHSQMPKKERQTAIARIKDKRFKLLLTTSAFLTKNFSAIEGTKFDFIFVDDVDALFKASRNVERLLSLLGFADEEIKALKVNKRKKYGQLLVSTATASPGKKARFFPAMLGFGVGRLKYNVREIDDFLIQLEDEKEKVNAIEFIVKRLGYGGLIFTRTKERAEYIQRQLSPKFLSIFSDMPIQERQRRLESFKSGKIDGLIGVASPYGLLSRGIDLPYNIAYVIFYDVPIIKIDGQKKDTQPEEKQILDLSTYLQSSGRASRLTPFGITKGVSFVLGTDEELGVFETTALSYDLDAVRIGLEELDFDKLHKQLWDSRRERSGVVDIIKPVLLVVESPTKAKQIATFFGRPAYNLIGQQLFYETAINDKVLIVTASIGHITDLVEDKAIYGVEVKEGVFRPLYGSVKRCYKDSVQFVSGNYCPICGRKARDDSLERIKNILKFAQAVGWVLLGSDPDREGEKIAFDISEFVKHYAVVERVKFQEVTKKALLLALENKKGVDKNLVWAQICRRIEDRWIGFSLSAILRRHFRSRHLSAGRAQSPVLHWIVENTNNFFNKQRRLFLCFEKKGLEIEITEGDWQIGAIKVNVCIDSKIKEVILPAPPFSTDLVLREVNRLFSISANKTMQILQDLFESGLITYHRTDSFFISDYGYRIAKVYLKDNFVYRRWEEFEHTHECIRPTRPWTVEDLKNLLQKDYKTAVQLTPLHLKIYDLIFRRFMASLSGEVEIIKGRYKISSEFGQIYWEVIEEAKGLSYQLYPWFVNLQQPIETGACEVVVKEKLVPMTRPFSQADIIFEMKKKKIGRPSTYAAIIDRLFRRGYVVERKQRLFATKRGQQIDQFLFSNYYQFVCEQRTAEMEHRLDEVEKDLFKADQVLLELYNEVSSLEKGV